MLDETCGTIATRFGSVEAPAIAAAPNGDLVLVGTVRRTTNLGGAPLTAAGDPTLLHDDAWVARYRADGSHGWSNRPGGDGIETASAVTVDDAGDVYVTGGFADPVDFGGGVRAGGGGFVVKLAGGTGAYVWDRTFGATGTAMTFGITTTTSGVVVMSGAFTGTIDFGGGPRNSTPLDGRDCVLVAYDTLTGVHRWSKPLTSSGDENLPTPNVIRCGAIGTGKDVIAMGGFYGTLTLGGTSLVSQRDSDLFIAKFRGNDGSHVWSIRHGGPSLDLPRALATDGAHILIGGSLRGISNFGQADIDAFGEDAFVASYNVTDGPPVWSQHFGDPSRGSRAIITNIAASTELLGITISFMATLAVGDQYFTNDDTTLTPLPDTAIVRMMPTSGEPIHAWHFGSTGADPMALTCAGRGLAGIKAFAQTAELFGTPLASLGNDDLAVFHVERALGQQ